MGTGYDMDISHGPLFHLGVGYMEEKLHLPVHITKIDYNLFTNFCNLGL